MDRTRTVLLAAWFALVTAGLASAQPIQNGDPTTRRVATGKPVRTASTSADSARAGSAARHGAPAQVLRVGDVHIEGKLYSPQALFILSRPEERFGRDVVVPQVLQLQQSGNLLPYRLRPEILAAERAKLDAPASGPAPHAPGGRP